MFSKDLSSCFNTTLDTTLKLTSEGFKEELNCSTFSLPSHLLSEENKIEPKNKRNNRDRTSKHMKKLVNFKEDNTVNTVNTVNPSAEEKSQLNLVYSGSPKKQQEEEQSIKLESTILRPKSPEKFNNFAAWGKQRMTKRLENKTRLLRSTSVLGDAVWSMYYDWSNRSE